MPMIEIAVLTGDESFAAYCAEPQGAPRGAIVVIQEIFGLNPGIRVKCDHWASLGYLALAPDLFWRLEPGVVLDPDIPSEFQEALGLMQRFDQDQGVADIEATIREAQRRLPPNDDGSAGKVGAVGYCLGGRLAFMTAARTDVNAAVGYYGVGLEGLMGEKHAIAHPLMLHIAGADHFVTPDKQALIHAGLDEHPKATLHDYPGEDHGFAAAMGKRRSANAAMLADARTEAFFAEYVG